MILGAISLAERLDKRWPIEIQAAAVGALVGIIGWFSPELIGGGDDITQRVLTAGTALGAIPLAFVVRFGLGAACYAVRTPGGLFAPLLVLGAQLGLLFRALCQAAFPSLGIEPEAFAVVGMARFHRRRAGAGDRDRARHRDDCGVYDLAADAGGVFRGNGRR